MPIMGGVAFTILVCQQDRDTPVVSMTRIHTEAAGGSCGLACFGKSPTRIWRMALASLECPKFRNSHLRGDSMEFAFPWPMSQGEWLAWSSAVVTLLLGLLLFLAPGLGFRILRLQVKPEKAAAIAEGRGRMSGFYLGVGLCCILLAQPLLYMALGFSWLFTAFGRLLSMMSDGANTPFNWVSIVVELVLAALPLAFAFGFVP
jgi:hypothetical protein